MAVFKYPDYECNRPNPLDGRISTGAVGMFLSYYLNISSAAMIVLTAAGLFLMVEAGFIFRRAALTSY